MHQDDEILPICEPYRLQNSDDDGCEKTIVPLTSAHIKPVNTGDNASCNKGIACHAANAEPNNDNTPNASKARRRVSSSIRL